MFEAFLFYLCGALMVLAGVLMVASRNAVVSACWLIFAFICGAGIFALLSAPFVAVLQVLVYAGAIMVLFLFVIMMLQGPVLEAEKRPTAKWLWPGLALPPVVILVLVFLWLRSGGAAVAAADLPDDFGTVTQVADLLLNKYLLAFELISVVLLVAIIGAVALGRIERRLPWK